MAPAAEAWSLTCWTTREVPSVHCLLVLRHLKISDVQFVYQLNIILYNIHCRLRTSELLLLPSLGPGDPRVPKASTRSPACGKGHEVKWPDGKGESGLKGGSLDLLVLAPGSRHPRPKGKRSCQTRDGWDEG